MELSFGVGVKINCEERYCTIIMWTWTNVRPQESYSVIYDGCQYSYVSS